MSRAIPFPEVLLQSKVVLGPLGRGLVLGLELEGFFIRSVRVKMSSPSVSARSKLDEWKTASRSIW